MSSLRNAALARVRQERAGQPLLGEGRTEFAFTKAARVACAIFLPRCSFPAVSSA
jgi:hypothetical protein